MTQRETFKRAFAQACATLSAMHAREGAGAHELVTLLDKHVSDAKRIVEQACAARDESWTNEQRDRAVLAYAALKATIRFAGEA